MPSAFRNEIINMILYYSQAAEEPCLKTLGKVLICNFFFELFVSLFNEEK
jgi:hypothetical protein